MKTNKNRISVIVLLVFLVAFLGSCNYDPRAGIATESPTRGNIKIGVDETFYLLTEAELYTFQSIYEFANITPLYKPETDVWDDFINDSVKTIITSRKMTSEEEEYLKALKVFPKTTKIAYDGIAFIVNLRNKDSLIRYNDMRDIFKGSKSKWSQINTSASNAQIKVVFDNNKSSTVRYVREKFDIEGSLPSHCYAVNNNEEVINYVEKNTNAIGVLAVNWISDKNDSITRGFLKRVRVVAVSPELHSEGIDFYKPYQGFIAEKSYPFIREVYMINRESYTGLGAGFVQFVAGEKGQRIILKMGMVPATMPIRLIKTATKF